MQVNLKHLPNYSKTYEVAFPLLNGGLNIRDLDYRLEQNESPLVQNLWWQDGVLQSRDGHVYLYDNHDGPLGTGYACTTLSYHGRLVIHAGTALYTLNPEAVDPTPHRITSGVPAGRGTFFRYDGALFYKNRGGYFRIDYDSGVFSATDMTDPDEAYTPTIIINADPDNGSGDIYQPENRLSPRKTVRYVGKQATDTYHLPVSPVDDILRVEVDGSVLAPDVNYSVNLSAGSVIFQSGDIPADDARVEITYSKENDDAYQSILDCLYACTAGEGNDLCILMAGSTEQPNAVFWNANDTFAMNPGYFPMTNYNLCGDSSLAVTGFGRQYNDLIVFKERSVGKLIFSVEQVDGRDSILFAYQNVNDRIGCDLPWSIQLVQNNLVFANTRTGIFVVLSSSAAYENNIQCISEKINGTGAELEAQPPYAGGAMIPGLLCDLRKGGVTTSIDDHFRYWLKTGEGKAYVWDYEISTYAKPSWFYFTDIDAVCFHVDEKTNLYQLDADGSVAVYRRSFYDEGYHDNEKVEKALDKVYRFPTQMFGSYDRLKDVLHTLLVVRSDTNTEVTVRYATDYEVRDDLTKIVSMQAWRLSPRDLHYRNLGVPRFGHVAIRKPGCRHIRYFALTLENNKPRQDLSVVSAQIAYRFQGKER